MDITPRTTVKEERDILEDGMANEKAIKILERPLIPHDLVDSASEMDSYLTQLREDSKLHEKYRLRSMKAVETRRSNLEAAARKIIIEPSTDSESVRPIQKTWHCKTLQTEKTKIVACVNVLEDSGIVVEKRVGYKVTCPRCAYQWIWHGRKDRFFISCSRCHKSFKLNWK